MFWTANIKADYCTYFESFGHGNLTVSPNNGKEKLLIIRPNEKNPGKFNY